MNVRLEGLSAATRRALLEMVEEFDEASLSEEAAFAQISRLAARLPNDLLGVLFEFRESRNQDALVLEGIPLGSMAEAQTPNDPIGSPRYVKGLQAVQLAVLATLATPFAYVTQQGGRLINNIAPSRQAKEQPNIGIGSDAAFDIHTEDAFMDNPPSFLQLACIRNPTSTGTLISGLNVHLSEEVEKALRDPVFMVGTNPAQDMWKNLSPGPVLYGPAERPFLRFNSINTDICPEGTSTHKEALVKLNDVLKESIVEIENKPGDLLIVNNYHVCHARNPFAARFDGNDRWLQRIVGYRDPRVVSSLTQIRGYPMLLPG
jgi:L-asparagine oxygenase